MIHKGGSLAVFLICGFMFLFGFCFFSDSVFAVSRPGSDGTAVNTRNCNNTSSFTVNVCSDKTGGASWYLFKKGSKIYKNYQLYTNGPRFCIKTSGYKQANCSRIRALKGGSHEYDRKLTSTFEKQCKGEDYYMAYVLVGCNGNDNKDPNGRPKKKNVPTLWGPLAWDTPLIGKSKNYNIAYNTYGQHTYGDIKKAWNNNQSTHKWKLTRNAALKVYQSMEGGSKIPKGTGYVCAKRVELKMVAYNLRTGKKLSLKSPKQPIDRDVVLAGNKASVTAKGNEHVIAKNGKVFTFVKQCNDKGTGCTTKKGYENKKLKKDTIRRAYYDYEDPAGEESTIMIEAKNNAAKANEKYKDYGEDVVYAKPGDNITYRVEYEANAQKSSSREVNKVDVVGDRSYSNEEETAEKITNLWTNWENKVNVYDHWKTTYSWSNGVSGPFEIESPFRVVWPYDVGTTIEEVAETSSNTPRKVEISVDSETGKMEADIWRGLRDSVQVKVPYNFTTEVESEQKREVVFAGERAGAVGTYKISIGDKVNNVTTDGSEPYRTRADGVTGKIIVFTPAEYDEEDDDDWEFDDEGSSSGGYVDDDDESEDGYTGGEDVYIDDSDDSGGQSGSGGSTGGQAREEDSYLVEGGLGIGDSAFCGEGCKTYYSSSISVNGTSGASGSFDIDVPDVEAGTIICAVAAVFPVDSGADDNISTSGYTQGWNVSIPQCFIVAKKPSVQVWGGNVYSNVNITTALADKIKVGNKTMNRTFGSWGELGVISSGIINGFGSGASLGYGSNGDDPGGSETTARCNFYPLTFPNGYLCRTGVGGWPGIGEVSSDKVSVVDKLIPADKNGAAVSLIDCLNGGKEYCYNSDNQNLPGATVDASKGTRMLHSGNNIFVSGDLKYADGEFETFSDIPKLVIYAKNIYIGCNVGRIDALLIAEQNVKTCADENGNEPELITSGLRSNQLRINGAVIANGVSLGRTYGAATGNNSITPAEIINFDPSLYLWAKDAETGANGQNSDEAESISSGLTMSFTHELAPRK